MKVLIACEESQEVCKAFRALGHEAYSCDIQPYEFGEVWSKKTYLWEFGVPHLMPTEIVADHKPFLPSGTGRKLRGDTCGAKMDGGQDE